MNLIRALQGLQSMLVLRVSPVVEDDEVVAQALVLGERQARGELHCTQPTRQARAIMSGWPYVVLSSIVATSASEPPYMMTLHMIERRWRL